MEAHDKKKEIMNEFAENNLDKDILRELRHSISDDSSSTSTYSSSNPFEPIQEETHAIRVSQPYIVTNDTDLLSVIDVEEGNFHDISELSQDDNHIIKPKFSVMKTIEEAPLKTSPKESIEKPLKVSSKKTVEKPSDKPSDKVRPTPTPELVDTFIAESHVTELLTPPGSPVPIISMNKLIPDGMYLSSESNDEYVFTV
jgi:hypothetical protein